MLLAVILDITGHGVGPAFATFDAHAAFAQWCAKMQKTQTPETHEAKAQMLAECAGALNLTLLAGEKSEDSQRHGTAQFAMIDSVSSEIYKMAKVAFRAFMAMSDPKPTNLSERSESCFQGQIFSSVMW